MNLIKIYIAFVLILMFCFACQKKVIQTTQTDVTESRNEIIHLNNFVNNSQTSLKTKNLKDKRQPYLGCWSGADNDNTIFHFTEKTVHTSVNKKQIINYEDISENPEQDGYLLKLEEKDDHNYLQEYLRVSFFKDGDFDGILVENSDSTENLKDDKLVGRIKVYKDNCKKVMWRLKFKK